MKTKTHPVIKVFMVVFGLAAIVWGISALRTDTSSWPAVQAKIVSMEAGDGLNYSGMYEYQVDGVTHSGSYRGSDRLSKGDEITVYYDPASPGSSITSPGEMGLVGVIGLALGLFCVGGIGWEQIKSIAANRRQAAAPTDRG